MGPAGVCPCWVWWPLELFHGGSLGRGTSVGEAVPAHHPPVPWLSCAAPSCPSFLPGSGLKVLPRGQLRLLRAAPEDAGTYLCMARNPSGTAAGRTRLIVQGTAAIRAPALARLLSPSPAPLSKTWLPSCEQVPALLPHVVSPPLLSLPFSPMQCPHHCNPCPSAPCSAPTIAVPALLSPTIAVPALLPQPVPPSLLSLPFCPMQCPPPLLPAPWSWRCCRGCRCCCPAPPVVSPSPACPGAGRERSCGAGRPRSCPPGNCCSGMSR